MNARRTTIRWALGLLAAAGAGLTGCNEETPRQDRSPPVVESLTLTASNTDLQVGETTQFTVTGTLHREDRPDEPFEEDFTPLVEWVSSDPSILLPGPEGFATAHETGEVTVFARTPEAETPGAGLETDPLTVTISP